MLLLIANCLLIVKCLC